MINTNDFAEIAALSGEPARAAMLFALMDGRALTAGELSGIAGVTPQTASGHLSQMEKAGLVSVISQGRHRYFSLSRPEVAHMIEAIAEVAGLKATKTGTVRTGPREEALRRARTCYNHIAGALGVGLADALSRDGHVELDAEAALLTPSGLAFLERIGIDSAPVHERLHRRPGRVVCRACMDWSERRPHIAGLVGTILFDHSLLQGWVRRSPGTRALIVTPKGQSAFREHFGLRLG
jgi:DNA-binding transcriptional ArsR family regulator